MPDLHKNTIYLGSYSLHAMIYQLQFWTFQLAKTQQFWVKQTHDFLHILCDKVLPDLILSTQTLILIKNQITPGGENLK